VEPQHIEGCIDGDVDSSAKCLSSGENYVYDGLKSSISDKDKDLFLSASLILHKQKKICCQYFTYLRSLRF